METRLIKIQSLLDNVRDNKSGIFSNKPHLVVILNKQLSVLIGDEKIHLSEFVIAKIKGRIAELQGHPEIMDGIFLLLPIFIQHPQEILRDTRAKDKYLFIISNPFVEVVIEVRRIESGKTEINTMHKLNIQELKRLERKFPVVL
ncbi:MAG: hypothetical protein Q7S72_00060 [Candidatus Taylorbacteria bacterium]|nr:hypothetical protein [Candidatus Taylorbacteria bacterium]